MSDAIASLRRLYAQAHHAEYIGEAVSQTEHALQAAHFAREAGATPPEIAAALLHDVGHLCAADEAPRMGDHGVAGHEHVGAEHLASLGFGEDVTALVRGHVDAKRYLVGARPDYAARLSDASRVTLSHQGGAMSAEACARFEARPDFEAVLRVRAWDEAAKVPNLEVAGFDAYLVMLEALVTPPVPPVSGSTR